MHARFGQPHQIRLRMGFSLFHVKGGHHLLRREAVRVGMVQFVYQALLPGAGDDQPLQSGFAHLPQDICRACHRFAIIISIKKRRLLLIEMHLLLVRRLPSECTLDKHVYNAGSRPPLVQIKVLVRSNDMMPLRHLAPRTGMEAHRIIKHAVHIEQHRLRIQPLSRLLFIFTDCFLN